MVDARNSDFFGPRQLEPGEDDNNVSQNFIIPGSSNDETEWSFINFSPEEPSILLNYSAVVDQTDEGFLAPQYAPPTQSAGTGTTSSDHSQLPNNPPYAPPAQSATANTLVADDQQEMLLMSSNPAEGLCILHNYSQVVVDQTDDGFLPPQYAPPTQSAGTGTSSDHRRQPNNPLCAPTAQSAAANSLVAANHWSQQFLGQQSAHPHTAGTGTSDHSRQPNNLLCGALAQSAAADPNALAANHWSQPFAHPAQLCVTKPTRTTALDAVVKRDKKRASDRRSNEKKKLKIEEMERKNGELTEENSNLKRENEGLKDENGKLRGENERLRVEITDLNVDNDSSMHENIKLKGENGDLNNEIGRLKGVNERLMGDTRELNNTNESLRHKNEILNREYEGSRYENESLKHVNDQLSINLGNSELKCNELNASVQNLTQQLVYQNFQLEIVKLTFANAQLKRNASDLDHKVSQVVEEQVRVKFQNLVPPTMPTITHNNLLESRKDQTDEGGINDHGVPISVYSSFPTDSWETGVKTTVTNENYQSLKLENANEIHFPDEFWMTETKVDKEVGPFHKLGKPNSDLELHL